MTSAVRRERTGHARLSDIEFELNLAALGDLQPHILNTAKHDLGERSKADGP